MKGLLHSKTFRTNLKKWLFMYVGTLCVFTSVITYSKYISDFNSDKDARTAKFNIKVEYIDNKCSNSTDSLCSTDLNRPLEEYDFYFKVDTSELEVKSLVGITTSINSVYLTNELNKEDIFEIKKIVEVKEDLKTEESILYECKTTQCKTSYTDSYTVMPENTKNIKYYKVSVSHKIQDNDLAGGANDRVVIVGYSAMQTN